MVRSMAVRTIPTPVEHWRWNAWAVAAVAAGVCAGGGGSSGASCETPASREELQPVEGAVSNEHTAKFFIFAEKARRCTAQGQYHDAEQWWHKAEEQAVRGFGSQDAHLAVVANGLAELYRIWGGERRAAAEALYRRGAAILEREVGPGDVRFAQALQHLGLYLMDCGRHAEALRELERAAAIKRAALGDHHADYAETLSLTAEAYRGMRDTRRAISTLRRCLEALAKTGRDEGTVAAAVKRRLVAALLDAGKPRDALDVVRSMVNYAQNVHIPEHVTTMKCLEDVAAELLRRGDPEPLHEPALAMLQARQAAFGDQDAAYAVALRLVAAINAACKAAERRAEGMAQSLQSAALLREHWQRAKDAAGKQLARSPSWWFWQQQAPTQPVFVKLKLNACALEYGRSALQSYSLAQSLQCNDSQRGAARGHMQTATEALSDELIVNLHTTVERHDSQGVRVPWRQLLLAEKRRLELLLQLLGHTLVPLGTGGPEAAGMPAADLKAISETKLAWVLKSLNDDSADV